MITIAAGAIAKKFFGRQRADSDQEVQGEHPIVRAMFRAINTGDDAPLRSCLDPELRVYLNDYPVTDHVRDHGPMLLLEAMNDLRLNLPDIRWELFDEVSGKDDGVEKVAIRFASKSTLGGTETNFSVAGFGIVQNGSLVEWRQVADLETFEAHRAAAHRPPITPTADSGQQQDDTT